MLVYPRGTDFSPRTDGIADSRRTDAGPRTDGAAHSRRPLGQEVFAATCAACHGANGEGQPNWHIRNENGTLPAPPLNGDGHTWHHSDGLLYRIVSQGGKFQETPEVPSFKSAMPAFGELLSHDEIVATLEYVKSLWGDKIKRGLSIRESQGWLSEGDPYPAGGG